MGISTEFDPEVIHAKHLSKPLSPEQVGASFVKRDDVFVGNLGQNPFLFTPHSRAIGPFSGLAAVIEQPLPYLGIAVGKGMEVMLHLQKRAARLTAIDD